MCQNQHWQSPLFQKDLSEKILQIFYTIFRVTNGVRYASFVGLKAIIDCSCISCVRSHLFPLHGRISSRKKNDQRPEYVPWSVHLSHLRSPCCVCPRAIPHDVLYLQQLQRELEKFDCFQMEHICHFHAAL